MIHSDPTFDNNIYINLSDAEYRAEHITNVSYQVDLALPKGEHYWGRVSVQFELKKMPAKPLFLDYRGISISQLFINGNESTDDKVFRDHKVYINSSFLQEVQPNKVEFYILNKYRKDGHGLHSFVDQEDNEQYLFSQFEPDYCHFVIPSFDQPDLKATWTLSVVAPQYWAVIANTQEEEKTEDKNHLMVYTAKIFGQDASKLDNTKTFQFKESQRYSSYLYAIVAGPYEYFESNVQGFVPMRIYARKSIKPLINPQEMFKVTQIGMNFYKELFGKEYPFTKYDQLFVPEHNSGAMENVGCVTFNENYLFRGEFLTLTKRLRFAITNLHELAHMWFGNLVTMKWWNDLWLNESFATFMSIVVLAEDPQLAYFKTQWVTFLTYKYWGISEDQLSTTHPITCTINRTDEAESIFDGISYGKGASFLKQLYKMLGRDVVKIGLHIYFEKFQWKNTELKDFVGSLNEAFKAKGGNQLLGQDFDLVEWTNEWLTTSGINILEPVVEYNEDGSIAKLQIKQTCDLRGKNRLRKQRIDVGLYDKDFNQLVINDIIISDQQELSDVEVTFKEPVNAVLINVNDHGYAKIRFDQKSMDAFVNNLHRIQDPLTRASFWRQAWLLVMDRKMSSMQYFDFVVKQLPYETVDQTILVALMNLKGLIQFYLPTNLIISKQKQMFQTLVDLLQKPDINESVKSPLVENIFSFISDTEHTKLAMKWLETQCIFKTGQPEVKIFELSKKNKFSILKAVFRDPAIPKEQKFELLEKTMGDDKSDIAINVKETCLAYLPDPDVKAQIWQSITNTESKESMYTRQAKMEGFYDLRQLDLNRPYFDKFYEVLPIIFEKESYRYFQSFFYSMLPRIEIKDEHILKLVSLKLKTPDNQNNLTNTLNEGIELLMRCKEIREFAAKL